MPKALMPKHCEGRATKTADKEVTGNGRKLRVAIQRMKQEIDAIGVG